MTGMPEHHENEIHEWHRLSPIGVVYFILRTLVNAAKHGVQGLVPLAAIFVATGDSRWFILSLVAIAAFIFLIAIAILSYLKFHYKVTDDTFYIKSGIFKKKDLTLHFERIQNVAFTEPLYFRPFDLVIMTLESAGSSSEEVNLGGIPRSLANVYRTKILNFKNNASTASETINIENLHENTESEDVIQLPLSELIRYGLMNTTIWVIAAAIIGFISQIDSNDEAMVEGLKDNALAIIGTNEITIALYGITAIIFVVAFLLLLSIIGTIIVNYDYRLTRSKDRFHRTKGLFERQETSLLESKIQSLVINQPWIAKLLNRNILQLTQVGFSNKSGQELPGSSPKFLIPSVTKEFSHNFSSTLYPAFDLSSISMQQISRLFTRKILLWVFLPISLIPATAIAIGTQSVWGLLPLLLPIIAAPAVIIRHKKYGFAMQGEYAVVRSGFIGHKLSVFPLHKVQRVNVTQSPGQRRAELATLQIHLAGTSLTIPYIPMQSAIEWRDTILYKVETSEKPWM